MFIMHDGACCSWTVVKPHHIHCAMALVSLNSVSITVCLPKFQQSIKNTGFEDLACFVYCTPLAAVPKLKKIILTILVTMVILPVM